MTRVSTGEEGRSAGLGASSFNRAVFAGACAGYEPCFVRMGRRYGEDSPWSTMQGQEVIVQVQGSKTVRKDVRNQRGALPRVKVGLPGPGSRSHMTGRVRWRRSKV